MKLYSKRVAFVISSQHFIAHGGIGSFAKSFSDMAEKMGWAVDYVLDKAPQSTALTEYISQRHRVVYPPDAPRYSRHTNMFVFNDTMHLERMISFRNSMMLALEDAVYDMVLVNSVDAVSPIYYFGLHDYIPVVYYTHSENLVFLDLPHNKVFNKASVDYMKHLMSLPGITVGTQSEVNVQHIQDKLPHVAAVSLPMQVPEPALLEDVDCEQEGVMFIGRFEPRKQPKLFADIIANTGLKAKILTNGRGAKKFQDYFQSIGYDNYEIRSDIIGREKVDWIKSARLGFHTANLESYGFSAFETLHACRTFCLEEYTWWKNFQDLVEVTNKQDAVQDLIRAYNEPFDRKQHLEKLRQVHARTAAIWEAFLCGNPMFGQSRTSRDSNTLKVLKGACHALTARQLFNNLGRDTVAWDDVEAIYKRSQDINMFQTRDCTLLDSREQNPSGDFVPPPEESDDVHQTLFGDK